MSSQSKKAKHSSQRECVHVVVRCRPMNGKESTNNCKSVVSVLESENEIRLGFEENDSSNSGGGIGNKKFNLKKNESTTSKYPFKMHTFDAVFGTKSVQSDIYDKCARDIVDSVINGYNGTIFAYGQTGTGKTYTMEGANNRSDASDEQRGIIPRTFTHIFNEILNENNNTQKNEYLIRCSFIEIYNDAIRDLLVTSSPKRSKAVVKNLELREHSEKGVYIPGLTIKDVANEDALHACFSFGTKNRHTAATDMNRDSSRSHSVFCIIIECECTDENENENADDNESNNNGQPQAQGQKNIRVGKLYLIDLAGSERQSKTNAVGLRFTEAININLSLSALGNVINALTQNKNKKSGSNAGVHIPYRDSKLTRILQDSLGGNSKTMMIANIGPTDYNYEETLNTLRFASRAKSIENKPHINEDPKDAIVRQYKEEILRLKQQLLMDGNGSVNANGTLNGIQEEQQLEHDVIYVPKIIEQKILKQGMSVAKVKRMEELQLKEEQKLKAQLENEKKRWKKNKQNLESNLKQNEKQLQMKNKILLNKKNEREKTIAKLNVITQKLMDGSQIMNKAKKQRIELKIKKEKLAQKIEMQRNMKRELEHDEKKYNLLLNKYETHESELLDKSKKLKKLYEKYKVICESIENMQCQFQYQREEYLNNIRFLSKQIMLKDTFIQFFINPYELESLSNRIVWNAESEQWRLNKINLQEIMSNIHQLKPASCRASAQHKYQSGGGGLTNVTIEQPVCEWNRIQSVLLANENTRYKQQNIIQLELDMPQRTTQDFQ